MIFTAVLHYPCFLLETLQFPKKAGMQLVMTLLMVSLQEILSTRMEIYLLQPAEQVEPLMA